VTEIVLVVDDPVHPVGRVQVNVYGVVPPVAEAEHVNALPEVTPVVGHVVVSTNGWPPTVTVAALEAVTVLPSCEVLLIE